MRRKKLLTAILCIVLAAASCTVSSTADDLKTASRQEVSVEDTKSFAKGADKENKDNKKADTQESETKQVKTETQPGAGGQSGDGAQPASETKTTDTNPPETNPPETNPPETNPPETNPPETNPPETNPPETNPPETQPPTETKPTETQPATETNPPETQPVTETLPSETQPGTETLPSETQPGTETLPSETQPGTETILTESESQTAEETESESESESESETSEFSSNEELISHQNIVVPPDIELEFRFTKIEESFAVVKNKEGAAVYEEKSSEAREVGALAYYGSCFILEDREDGWYYIESGNVRGFVKADDMVTGETAQRIRNVKGEEELPLARLLVARTENEAFLYTHTTVQEVMAEKEYALASGEVKIYEQRNEDSDEIGILADQSLCYILADSDKEWVFVESGDARGFVEKSSLITGTKADAKVSGTGENNMPLAQVLVEPEENKACYYTLASVKAASQSALTRESMVNFALQFVGNPYVWGGTSLTHGADCSGYVQSIYAYYGYSLPRVAEDQAQYGMQIPVESAEPGDLIFYARNGYVYHVSMYIGNGQVVHAAGRKVGIITSGIGGNAVWATRIIAD